MEDGSCLHVAVFVRKLVGIRDREWPHLRPASQSLYACYVDSDALDVELQPCGQEHLRSLWHYGNSA
jgi:hypothetical protein